MQWPQGQGVAMNAAAQGENEMTDIAKIAAGLTKAHQGIILYRTMPNGECIDAGAYFDLPEGLVSVVSAGFGYVDYLTPLGLAVRDYLKENNHVE
jgi:hypothetical protein